MSNRLTDRDRVLIEGMYHKRGAIYGGDDVAGYLEGARSMGDLCVKRLTRFGERVILVRRFPQKTGLVQNTSTLYFTSTD